MDHILKEFDTWFQRAYYLSQIILVIVAIFAAKYALEQSRTAKTYEMLKYLESIESRKARRKVFRNIDPISEKQWWDDEENAELEEAASNVAAIYDVMYLMLKNENIKV